MPSGTVLVCSCGASCARTGEGHGARVHARGVHCVRAGEAPGGGQRVLSPRRSHDRIRVPVPEPVFDMKIYPLSWGTHDAALMPHIIVGHAQCGLDAAHNTSLLAFGAIPDWNSRSLGQREEVHAVALRTPMHVSIVRGRADVFPLMGRMHQEAGELLRTKAPKSSHSVSARP